MFEAELKIIFVEFRNFLILIQRVSSIKFIFVSEIPPQPRTTFFLFGENMKVVLIIVLILIQRVSSIKFIFVTEIPPQPRTTFFLFGEKMKVVLMLCPIFVISITMTVDR